MTGSDVPTDDAALCALRALVGELASCIDRLAEARERAESLLAARESGSQWRQIVRQDNRPQVVESISGVLGSLSTAGHTWRREQAAALRAEGVSINQIAAVFGVTRQRISALLKEDDGE